MDWKLAISSAYDGSNHALQGLSGDLQQIFRMKKLKSDARISEFK
jgi:hypothetical protein